MDGAAATYMGCSTSAVPAVTDNSKVHVSTCKSAKVHANVTEHGNGKAEQQAVCLSTGLNNIHPPLYGICPSEYTDAVASNTVHCMFDE